MNRLDHLEYNSQKDKLIIPEYGRNVQNLINFAKTVEDDEKRQAIAEEIIKLIFRLNPQSRNISEYKDKLWRHFYRIAEFDIDVKPPNGEVPTPKDLTLKPNPLDYPEVESRYRHYGHNVQLLVKKALEMEDPEQQKEFVVVIASFMKMAFKTWNYDGNVSNDIIRKDLINLSKGKLVLDENASIDYLSKSVSSRRNIKHTKSKGRSNNNHKRKGGGTNNRRKRRY